MLLTRAGLIALIALAPSLVAAQGAPPEQAPQKAPEVPAQVEQIGAKGGKGHGSVEFQIGYYDNGDSGDGNPFLDEALTVIEPVIVVTYNATDNLTLLGTLSYDFVSSASIDRLSNYPQQSGASGDNYVGADLGFKYKLSDTLRVGAHASASFEYDYRSFGFGGDVAIDLFEKNTTLTFGLNGFFDQVDLIKFNGAEDGDDDRLTLTFNAGWYQVLSPTVHMSLGLNITHQSGYLATSFNGVVLENPNSPVAGRIDPDDFINLNSLPPGVSIEAEQLPDTRTRNAIFGEVRKYFSTGTSVGIGARFYADTWGIVAGTLELKLSQWIVPKVLRARLRYRFYSQTAADDYEERFYVPSSQRSSDPLQPNQDRTQDSDLGDFTSHTIGLHLTWQVGRNVGLTFGGDYILRSDGIDQILGIVGVKFDF